MPLALRLISLARLSLLAVVLCASLAHAPKAVAQGTMGMLPGPISTQELDGYADRLGLSPQQRRALEAVHDGYKQEFRVLRDGEIAGFLTMMRTMEGGDGSMPDRKKVEEFLQQMDALTRKIAAIDNRMFDQLQPALTEEQLLMLPRTRLARHRARMNNMQIIWMGGQRPIDVSALAFGLDLAAADRAAIDPTLALYESKLTGDMDKLYDASQKTILKMYESLEKAGITEETMHDPEQAEKMAEAMQQVWMDMMATGQELTAAINDLNDRTQRSMAAAMSPEGGRLLRNRYYQQSYPETTYALYAHDYVFGPALKRDDLTAEQREAVIAARDDMQRRLDSILDQAVASSAAWRKEMNPFEYDQEKAEEHQKKQMELRADAEKVRSDANAALEAALGKELLDKIGRIKPVDQDAQDQAVVIAAAGGGGMVEATVALEEPSEDGGESDFSYGVDQFLPAAIMDMELRDMAERLALTDEQMTVVRELHQRYAEEFAKLNEAELGRLQKAVAAMWQYDEQTQTSTAPTVETINEIYRLRAAALEAIRKTDEAFFAEVELAALTPEQAAKLLRVRQARDRMIYNRASYSYWGGENNEGTIDLSRLISRRRGLVSADDLAAIDARLMTYEQTAVVLFRERYARALDAQKVQELWQAEITRAQADGESNNIKLGLRYQEMMREPQKALADASEAVCVLNRATMVAVCAELPDEAAQSLRAEYNRRAFPNVYGDSGAMDNYLLRAGQLPDLSAEQARRIGEINAQYHPAYAALCDEMIKASEGSIRNPWLATTDAEEITDWQKREETLAKLRFDRAEVNARAASQLRETLSEDQIKALGAMPRNDDDDRMFD